MRNCSDLRGSEGLKGENPGRIPVADAQADGYQTAFIQFAPPSLNSYTNAHVVERDQFVEVSWFADLGIVRAMVLGIDERADVALLDVGPDDFDWSGTSWDSGVSFIGRWGKGLSVSTDVDRGV